MSSKKSKQIASTPVHDTPAEPSAGIAQKRLAFNRLLLLPALSLILFIAVVAAHHRVLSAEAQSMNDGDYLFQNYRVLNPSWEHAWLFLTEVTNPSTVQGYYQPLAMISLMLDTAMGGDPPDDLRAYHRTSLILHALNTVLLMWLMYLLFGSAVPAALAALLFGVHPITVETLAWLGERKTPLAMCFALVSMVTYVRHVQTNHWRWYGLSITAFLLALMSKPTVTPLPVILVLLNYWPLRRLGKRALLETVPFFGLAGVFAIITVLSQQHMHIEPLREGGFVDVVLLACHNVLFYPLKILWPAELATAYPFPEPISLSQPVILAGTLLTAALIPLLLLSLKRTRAVAVGVLMFLLALAPTFVNVAYAFTPAADKYVYFPMIGLVLLLAWGIDVLWRQLAEKQHHFVGAAMSLVILAVAAVLSMRSHQYLGHWQSSEAYARHVIDVSPDSGWAYNNLALAKLKNGRPAEAAEHARTAIELNPQHAKAWTNLGEALLAMGQLEEAADALKRALSIRPKLVEAMNSLATVYSAQQQWSRALEQLQAARELAPESTELMFNTGVAHLLNNEPERALKLLEEVAKRRPENTDVKTQLARAEFAVGQSLAADQKWSIAIEHLERASRLAPDIPAIYFSLGHAYAAIDELDQAIEAFNKVIQLQPEAAAPRYALAQVLAYQNRRGAAIKAYRKVLDIDPDHEGARTRLDELLTTGGAPTQP